MKITVWNEYTELQQRKEIAEVYPDGLHITIKKFLEKVPGFDVRCAVITEPEHGLTDEILNNTDVLIWWGHALHDKVSDEVCNRVVEHVQRGMGIIFLHSAHNSKPFKRLMGTTCNLRWREADEKEILWTVMPAHPIAKGIGGYVEIEQEEMYGEVFDIPTPDELVFIGWFKGGNVCRSGVTYRRGNGKVFYFQPGHETNSAFHNEKVQQIIINAVNWAEPDTRTPAYTSNNTPLIEKI